jgi:hypothetical protein
MEHAEYAAGLRTLAEFIESHPELPLPHYQNFGAFLEGGPAVKKEAVIAAAKALASVTQLVKKQVYGEHMQLVWRVNSLLSYQVWVDRDAVCERVVTGVKVIPAREEVVLPAMPETTEETFEWRCSPVLAGVVPSAEVGS